MNSYQLQTSKTFYRKRISTYLVLVVVVVGWMVSRTNTTHEPKGIPQEEVKISTNLVKPQDQTLQTITSKPGIFAKSYIILDHDTKYPIIQKNADLPVAIASTTKIMTAIIALETLDPDRVLTISKQANSVDGSKVDFFTGEQIYVRDALYALMLHSANNAAVALSEADGSTDTFVAKMNRRAKDLGLLTTEYFDPAGLDDRGRSTARDLALLIDYAVDIPMFKTLISTPNKTFTSANGQYRHEVKNSNRLIRQEEPLYLASVIGGKTGFTYEAGHCLVAVAQFGSKRYVASILKTNADTNDASAYEMRKLLFWASTI